MNDIIAELKRLVLEPGTRLGPYEVTARIGAGGMGEVYRARDTRLNRDVALKILPDAVAGDNDRLSRFRNEARALSALNHPHIVTIYEVGQVGASSFIAMEVVEGETLRERLRRGPLPLRDAIEIVLQTARAIGAAHEKGLVHRDIKPENVMIRRDGYVKVLDFGLAVLRTGAETGQSLTLGTFDTVAAAAAGTPAYMSPEQLDESRTDARSDVFSLGVLLCESVTGKNPFARAGVLETVSAIAQTPEPAVTLIADLPPSLTAIILKALHKNPADRYPAVSDLAADLQCAIGTLDRPAGHAERRRRGMGRQAIAWVVVLLLIASAAALGYRRLERQRWVREQAIPAITRLAADEKFVSAFRLVRTAEQYLPGDPQLARAAAASTRIASIQSSPPGAIVEVDDYLSPGGGWLRLGTTPLDNVRIPRGYLRWRASKTGVGELISAPDPSGRMQFDLGRAGAAPPQMVPVPGGPWADSLAFLGWLGPYTLPAFFVDRFEVTNREYQTFVNQGGYSKPEYWKQPFVRDGRPLTWAEAMDLFRDTTQRPGPSTWEAGHYPTDKGDYPVAGVSWFEAAAYAEFAGKSLPVIAQAYKVAPSDLDGYVVRLSNLSGNLAPVGQFAGLGPYGTYDAVGNVREWSLNASDGGLRFVIGRQAGSYGPEVLPPFDRSALNGFRCVRNNGPIPVDAAAPRPLLRRDFSKAKPATDNVFRIYRNMYAYDRLPLHATVEAVPENGGDWTTEKIAFDAAYGNDRVVAFLFLPKHTPPPFQTVVFFPSARVNFLTSSAALGDMSFVDYVIKSGRAVIYPLYAGLYERRASAPVLPGPTLERETTVEWSKDLGRSIDYLESRPDIDASRLGYLGVSQGSAYGVILASLEDRLKAVVFLDGGYFQQENPLTGMDQADFAPRLTKPVLMVNGRYDATFPLESAQRPMFRMLGAPDAEKRHVIFDTPHDVTLRRSDLVREVLAWYDKYLGRVR